MPKVAGSLWEAMEEQGTLGAVTRLRLTGCPAGYILVRSTDKPNMDECMPCLPQTYSLEPATYSYKTGVGYLNSENAAKVVQEAQMCLPCPASATCNGADRVQAKESFWRGSNIMCPDEACDSRNGVCDITLCYNTWSNSSSNGNNTVSRCTNNVGCRTRPTIYRCQQGFCNSSKCREGHRGPLCALCDDGWAMDVRGCEKCDELGAWPHVVLTAVILFTLWMLYLFSWRPLVRERCKTCNYMGICSCCIGNSLRTEKMGFLAKALSAFVARLTSASASGYFKIILSFWQLTGTYNLVYNVDWPKELSELWNLLSYFFQLDILEMPSVSLVKIICHGAMW